MSPNQAACPVCDRTLKGTSSYPNGYNLFNCPSCGPWGATFIVGSRFSGDEPRKLMHLLCEHRIRGNSPVVLATRSLESDEVNYVGKDEFLTKFPTRPLEFFDRALLNLGYLAKEPNAVVGITFENEAALFTEPGNGDGMLTQLQEQGFIKITEESDNEVTCVVITPDGWRKIEELNHPGRDSRQAFVAMWFDKGQQEIFEAAIKPAIEADGTTKAVRIDLKEHNGKIDDEIVAEIRRSRYLVADFTGNRGGVYFEAGFALGLGLPVIWCVHQEHLKGVHFDTRQYNHIAYASAEDLRVRLLNRIRATDV